MRLRPYLSAKTPITGVRKTPGMVKKVISRPILAVVVPGSLWRMSGKVGAMLVTPMTTMQVMLKMIRRFLSRNNSRTESSRVSFNDFPLSFMK